MTITDLIAENARLRAELANRPLPIPVPALDLSINPETLRCISDTFENARYEVIDLIEGDLRFSWTPEQVGELLDQTEQNLLATLRHEPMIHQSLACVALACLLAVALTYQPEPVASTVLAVPPLLIDGPAAPADPKQGGYCAESAEPPTTALADVQRAIVTLARREDVSPASALVLAPTWVDAAERYGVDPALLVAIAWHESRFNVDAVSPDGCDCGVMQVRSATCIEGRPTCAELLDPETCIDEAARILADRGLVSYTGGSHRSALERLTTAWEITR